MRHVRPPTRRRRQAAAVLRVMPHGRASCLETSTTLDSEITRRVAALDTEALHPEFGCSPLVRYQGHPQALWPGEVVLAAAADACAQGVKVVLEGEGVRRETFVRYLRGLRVRGSGRATSPIGSPSATSGYAPRQIDVRTQTDVDLGEVVLTAL